MCTDSITGRPTWDFRAARKQDYIQENRSLNCIALRGGIELTPLALQQPDAFSTNATATTIASRELDQSHKPETWAPCYIAPLIFTLNQSYYLSDVKYVVVINIKSTTYLTITLNFDCLLLFGFPIIRNNKLLSLTDKSFVNTVQGKSDRNPHTVLLTSSKRLLEVFVFQYSLVTSKDKQQHY